VVRFIRTRAGGGGVKLVAAQFGCRHQRSSGSEGYVLPAASGLINCKSVECIEYLSGMWLLIRFFGVSHLIE